MKKENALDKIREHMRSNGIKYTWLCEKVGISTGHMSNIFGGNKSLSQELLDKINKALDTDFKLPTNK